MKLTFENVSGVFDGLVFNFPDVIDVKDDGCVEEVEEGPEIDFGVAQSAEKREFQLGEDRN